MATIEEQEIKEFDEIIHLDSSLKTPKERTELVNQIVSKAAPERLTQKYLQILSNYIIDGIGKEERKQKYILTQNHMKTVNDRETSFQGLASKFEQGEDGIYNLIANDKNIIFKPKVSITQKDIDQIPMLKALVDAIKQLKEEEAQSTGKKRSMLKKQIIELSQDQYIIKAAYRKPIGLLNVIKSVNMIDLAEEYYFDEENNIHSTALVNLLDPIHISAILRNYSALKENAWGNFWGDFYYFMEDFDAVCERALEEYPIYQRLILYKIDGKQGEDIQELLYNDFGVHYTTEHISSLWRKKIPTLIAETAQKEALIWYYTEKEKGKWKKCSCCKEVKLAHKMFFSKNGTSKDGFYSICKECRAKKYQDKKGQR